MLMAQSFVILKQELARIPLARVCIFKRSSANNLSAVFSWLIMTAYPKALTGWPSLSS